MIGVIDFGMGNIHSILKAISLFTSDYKLLSKPEELKDVSGIVLPGEIRRFRGKNFKIPHMGWNKLILEKKKNNILENINTGTYMYFIHSYRPINVDNKYVVANCSYYGEKFPVVVESNNIFGTQFHPEKSDRDGLKILENFIKLTL